MSKFYVQSGSLRCIYTAQDNRSAAIWGVHRALSQSLPFLCDDPSDYLALDSLTQLGETISVSQRGFDREDAVEFPTIDIVTEWNQLLVALDRLERRLSGTPEYPGVETAASSAF